MTYIKLSDVNKIYCEIEVTSDEEYSRIERINSLPSINPESMIEEMIEEQDSYTINQDTFDSQNNKKEVLKELLQKFKS